MPSTPTIRARNNQYKENIHKRGMVKKSEQKEEDVKPRLDPYLMAFIAFVVIGSAVFSIFSRL
ncbi:stress-associated endoplasmic reticulum protein [Polychytrium aggregatum]|uniref:stress-associated endoplasmic reticulum protein n=1 Tax=Polychytrium aggregatum TaxID=110093 RepID=UPI0022FE5EAC|nr:stress-associated endoplasmic reticulum protein [Polychytrium aggregatum]KAI9209067.1 stress-associated endoplasmic reticulum protein [Polychytrium aggregatum]